MEQLPCKDIAEIINNFLVPALPFANEQEIISLFNDTVRQVFNLVDPDTALVIHDQLTEAFVIHIAEFRAYA